ncbi:NADH-quinone oxidoreductase subunit M [Gloeobacter kilaueensis]|uniref:NAD(P)H-quinone oxidoreductase subunit 4 n=1 Tax=Gloeobacter kilaueensis (strain ATCC BAA-2537 / CCAP 1431/1 / ULC 316 / JS1) TaxID=1183438 RepID=U5QMV3_GLOK1|nr:NADH-quinone oxidoreductase subunit M [Gloeobacter kilaueensis]AGY60251.1 NAD(P)H-quinone oxidoreductase subunit 4 [Gloeobacter kilaueensis JS1]
MLSTLIWLPVAGAVAIGFWPNLGATRARQAALAVSAALLLWTGWLFFQFQPSSAAMQFSEFVPWIEPLGLNYSLGVDGLSLLMLALNALLGWVAVYTSSRTIERPQLYYALLLLVTAGLAGAFTAQNLLLFLLFYELELVPLFLLILLWGSSPKRAYAAMKFLTYTAVSGFLLLGAFLSIGVLGGAAAFALDSDIARTLPLTAQLVILTLLLLGFGIKTPLFPLHTWLPDAYCEASAPVAILLGGVLAKLGTYGLLRFGLGLFPETWNLTAPGLATLGAISAIYGAFAAIAQKDIKRMVAYSSIGHMGYVLLGLAAETPLSLLGAVLQMVSHGLILAVLFYLVGIIEEKAGTRDLDVLNGLMNPVRGLPLASALLVLAGMASAGIPGLVGFIAEFLVLQGSFPVFPVATLLCVVCSGLTAVYFVILLSRTCFGRLDNSRAYYPTIRWSERIPALVLVALIFVLGIQPSWLTHWSESTTDALAAAVPRPVPVAKLSLH